MYAVCCLFDGRLLLAPASKGEAMTAEGDRTRRLKLGSFGTIVAPRLQASKSQDLQTHAHHHHHTSAAATTTSVARNLGGSSIAPWSVASAIAIGSWSTTPLPTVVVLHTIAGPAFEPRHPRVNLDLMNYRRRFMAEVGRVPYWTASFPLFLWEKLYYTAVTRRRP
ncbi:hypothetical protein GMORB2_0376 [Geosmithia morbida]|uniref:Uncharacterized protein n=1 Tax=Geosmithia morbida TaxID=1094350 RepID=A0A9P4Z2R5_9HYPO|nr:uncharacterized protein GMORB2_0376 [Geosmithia morbida]KAF4126640.1 hypothetical protein GMORB2_0376 [Geosmithia morbida]